MTEGDYFFLIFLATIAAIRLLLLNRKIVGPTARSFRLRHYMYGVVLIVFSVIISNLPVSAIGLGHLADEIPILFAKGSGHREESWRYEDYYSPWSVSGVLILILLTYLFRNAIAALV